MDNLTRGDIISQIDKQKWSWCWWNPHYNDGRRWCGDFSVNFLRTGIFASMGLVLNGGCSCRTGGWSWSWSWKRSSGRPRTQKWTREILKFRKIQTKSVKWAWGLIQKVKEMSQHAEQHPSTQQYQVPEQQRSLWYSVAAFICAFGSCWNKIWRIGSFTCNSSAINLIWKAWDNNLI